MRSPLVVWGPGLIASEAAGATNNRSILCALDLNRSLYALTNTPLPHGVALDGEDVLDTLLGRSREGRKAPIFWRRPPDRPGTKEEPAPDLAVRDGAWKFLSTYDGAAPELYDLRADVSESKNLAEQHPDIVSRLKNAVLQWNAELPADTIDPPWKE